MKHVIIGMLLGDANLQTFNNGVTYRLKIIHSASQYNYVQHKFELFESFIRTQILHYNETRANRNFSKCYFNTVCVSSFKFYADMFYNNNDKKLPKLIHRYLDEVCIAYWYMDDGSRKWRSNKLKAVRLCTDNFSAKEVQRLVDILNEKYLLECSVYKQRSRFRIYIPNNNYVFSKLIEKYVISSMKYKLPLNSD